MGNKYAVIEYETAQQIISRNTSDIAANESEDDELSTEENVHVSEYDTDSSDN